MGHTPFSLVYGSKEMLPTEVEHKSFRVQQFNEEQSDDSRVNDLTTLEEIHEATFVQSAKHQQAMRPYHVRNASSCSFLVGDCHTPVLGNKTEASIPVPRMFKSHVRPIIW
jgi:hypothetical protein